MSFNFDSVNKYFSDRRIQLKPEWLRTCLKFLLKHKVSAKDMNSAVYDQWLHTDLKESTKPSFQPPVGKVFTGFAVLQVESILNITKPFYGQLREMERNQNTDLDIGAEADDKLATTHWDRKAPKRMLKFTLSDGVKTIKAIEHISNPQILPTLQPGAKVVVTRCQCRDQILLLTPRNCQFLDGYVPRLVEKNNPKALIKRMPFLQGQNGTNNVTVPKTNQLTVVQNDRKRKIDDVTINRPSTSGVTANPASRGPVNLSAQLNTARTSAASTGGPVNLSAQLNAPRATTTRDTGPGPSTSGYRPQIVIEPKRPQMQVQINRRPSIPPSTRPTTTSTTPQQPNEPVCLSMQLNNRAKKTTTAAPTSDSRPTTTPISVQINNLKRSSSTTRQIPQNLPESSRMPEATRLSMKEMLKTPHGTNLTMDNFAIPTNLDVSREQVKEPMRVDPKPDPPRPAVVVTPQKVDNKPAVLKTTPLSTSSKVNTPTSANSTRSSIAQCGKEFPFSCDHCDIGFKDRILYQIHMGLHGFKEPLTCNKCGHEAATALDFNLHFYDH
ncbi:unnamed protein product [Bursaphelenchus xylophilus]|uniref:RecQ-mediated genome instability protein 1 n=1 Tax=Bursaphelenchus xylophilus TaxID=6326 RepID=A0A1I7RXD9_BURXY|nr:unnamed protein product [Bursaphelenchus xylophilus]CAG9126311.1 unnamed protein product [Bursaphelenchus xylophilus]